MNRAFFTRQDVAKICRVAPRTVVKWAELGLLNFYRLPGSRDWRVDRDSLVRFLEKNGMPSRWLEEFESAIEEKSKTKTASKKTQTRDTEAALQPIVLNSREVAKVLGVSQDTVCKWSRAGLIPHVRLAGKKTILYPLDELKAWLASQVRAQANVKNRGKRKADRWQG